jgi:hypothetical protein
MIKHVPFSRSSPYWRSVKSIIIKICWLLNHTLNPSSKGLWIFHVRKLKAGLFSPAHAWGSIINALKATKCPPPPPPSPRCTCKQINKRKQQQWNNKSTNKNDNKLVFSNFRRTTYDKRYFMGIKILRSWTLTI